MSILFGTGSTVSWCRHWIPRRGPWRSTACLATMLSPPASAEPLVTPRGRRSPSSGPWRGPSPSTKGSWGGRNCDLPGDEDVATVPRSSRFVPRISGFTIVRNALKLDFPVEASIRSILPICDEIVVNVGRSEDETLELVRSIGDPKVRVLEAEWDLSRRNTVLGHETLRAMRACAHPWGVYIQADEVLHERGAAALLEAIREHDGDARVEGLLVRYLHFYGGFDTIATHRRWYRREVRAPRRDPAPAIRPHPGAPGLP